MNYGEKLLEFRAKHNLTQTALAQILGVCVMTVGRLENGYNKPSKMGIIKYDNKMKEWEKNNDV